MVLGKGSWVGLCGGRGCTYCYIGHTTGCAVASFLHHANSAGPQSLFSFCWPHFIAKLLDRAGRARLVAFWVCLSWSFWEREAHACAAHHCGGMG